MSNEAEPVFAHHRMRTAADSPGLLDWRSRRQQAGYSAFLEQHTLPSSRAYNLTISHQQKFVWFRVAKAGTTTILDELESRGAKLDVVRAMNVRYPVDDYADYFAFAFVRNPWDRLVSCWKTKVRKGNFLNLSEADHNRCQEFAGFVDYVETLHLATCNNHVRRQSALIDLNSLDFLGRLETLDADLTTVLETLGLPTSAIAARNVSTRSNSDVYRSFYDDTLAKRVGRMYRLDVQLFGYEF